MSSHLHATMQPVLIALVLLLPPTAGCHGRNYKGPERAAVSGTVTLDGNLVEDGTIVLLPMDGGGARKSGGIIENGDFAIPEERGPNLGTYRVQLSWLRPTGRAMRHNSLSEFDNLERVEAIPPEYNTDSTLVAEIGAGKNTLDFHLKSH